MIDTESKKLYDKLVQQGYQLPELVDPEKVQAGDLLITSEVVRVINPHYGPGELEVALILPACRVCLKQGRDPFNHPGPHIRVYDFAQNGALFKVKRVKQHSR